MPISPKDFHVVFQPTIKIERLLTSYTKIWINGKKAQSWGSCGINNNLITTLRRSNWGARASSTHPLVCAVCTLIIKYTRSALFLKKCVFSNILLFCRRRRLVSWPFKWRVCFVFFFYLCVFEYCIFFKCYKLKLFLQLKINWSKYWKTKLYNIEAIT